MSERRRMFDALMAPDPAGWPADEIKRALEECSSGPVSFGHMTEWSDWFPYLLHTAIDHVGPWDPMSVFGGLVTNMMVHCPNEAACSSYGEGLIEDVLLTVGRVPMAERFWSGDRMLDRSAFQPVQVWPVGMIVAYDSDIYAAFWLMAKYLPLNRLEMWLRSVMAIEDPAWGCGVLSWLAHTERVFEGRRGGRVSTRISRVRGLGHISYWARFNPPMTRRRSTVGPSSKIRVSSHFCRRWAERSIHVASMHGARAWQHAAWGRERWSTRSMMRIGCGLPCCDGIDPPDPTTERCAREPTFTLASISASDVPRSRSARAGAFGVGHATPHPGCPLRRHLGYLCRYCAENSTRRSAA